MPRLKNYYRIMFAIIFSQTISFIQAQETRTLPRDLYLDLGFKYIPFDYIGGPAFGLSYHSPEKKLSINLRYDIGFSIGKGIHTRQIDTIFISIPDNLFTIQDFQVRTYLEAELLVWESGKKKLYTSAGLGWIYAGNSPKYILNDYSGYYCLSVSAKYKLSWFYIEPRIDIPFQNRFKLDIKFPGSIALVYRFKPKSVD